LIDQAVYRLFSLPHDDNVNKIRHRFRVRGSAGSAQHNERMGTVSLSR
jgi:hypothetical protein